MIQSIQLTLPLSATALRLGSAFLSDLAAQSDVIRGEAQPQIASLEYSAAETTLEQDVQTAEASVIAETEEQKCFRLHGNIASAGMEPAPVIAQAEIKPTVFETAVIGYERNPEYAGANAAFEQAALEAVGWTQESLLADGYLIEVTEQRPLPVAHGASNPAPTPAPVPPAANGSAVELDADGLPWDSRIHSDAEVKLSAKGQWKTRRNLAPGFKEQIEAELRAVMGAPSATTASASAPAPSPAAPPAPVAAPPAPAPVAAPAAPAQTNSGGMTFADFTRYLVSNKADQGKVMVQVQKVGLTSIPDLAKRPDLIPAVVEGLKG